jgi:hypothetical protein
MKRRNADETLEGFVEPFDGEPSEWDDVLARSEAANTWQSRLPRTLIVAVAVVVGLLALTVPFGLAGRVVGLFRDEGKPVPVASLSRSDRESLIFSFCNRLRLVTPPGKAPERRCLDGEPTIQEIANNGTRLYWKITYPGGPTCLASGSVRGYRQHGGGRSRIGLMRCGGQNLFPTPRRPVTVDAVMHGGPRDTRAKLSRLSGLAGQGVTQVGLIEEDGDVLKEAVEGRTYDFGRPPDRRWTAVAAFDDSGDEVFRQPLMLEFPQRRPIDVRPRPPRPRPLLPLPKGPPLQHTETADATIDVYRSGLVDVRLKSTTGRAYLLLRPGSTEDPRVPVGCFNLAYGAGQWEAIGGFSYGTFGRNLRVSVVGGVRRGAVTPPFDACTATGSYGRRWNDARGMHDALEMPLTSLGHRFFAQRAAARDLSLFMRTPQMREIRRAMIRKAKIPSAAEIARRFPSRVVPMAARTDVPPRPNVGVWSDGRDRILAAKLAEDGRRLYATFEAGRFGPHNLAHLGFLIY